MNRKERDLPANELRLAGTEEFNGALYKHAENGTEVLAEVETRKIWANNYHRAASEDSRSMLLNAMASGDQLIAVREVVVQKRGDGRWLPWLEENFEGSPKTAAKYMQLARNREQIEGAGPRPQDSFGITAALELIATPKEEAKPPKSEQPEVIEAEEVEGEPVLVTLPGGKKVSPEEAKEFYEKDFQKLADERAKAAKALEGANKAKKTAKNAKEKAEKKLAEEQVQVHAEFRDAVRASFEEQLADIHARYGIEETPSIFEVDPAHFQEAIANTRDRREEEVLNILSDLFPIVSRIRQYEAQEAARACLKWPSPERAKEAIQDISEWMGGVGEEMEAQTTPGVLRAVKGDN